MKRRLSEKTRKGAVLMIMACAMLFIVLPAVGLAIDGAVAYSIRAKLQAATDAASVAAARSISRGLNPSDQYQSATLTAQRYFRANMNAAWNPLSAPDPVVTFPTATSPRTVVIHVETTAYAPTYFMKVLNINSVTISAMAETIRREVKIMMVLDRSGSLKNSNSCDDLAIAAQGFTDAFIDGRDEIGMVTFGTSYRVDYPITKYFNSSSVSGTNLRQMIGNIANNGCTGGTNSAAAYWTAYQSLIATPEAGVLNVILFFTDGQPNTVHMTNLEVAGASPCTDRTARDGVIAPSAPASGQTYGTAVLGIYSSVPSSAPPVASDQNFIANRTTCAFSVSSNTARNVWQDIVALTRAGAANEVDVFGNSLVGYKTAILRTNGRIRMNDNATIVNVGINALDSAATRARDDANSRGLDLVTYAIGLSNNLGAAEDALMNRVANTATSSNYNAYRPTGMYIRADNASQLDEAFAQLASEVMRFAK